jgi:hypothetical protein
LGQFAVGAVVAPLVGIAGTHSAIPTAIVIATMFVASFAAWTALATRSPAPAA